MAEQSKVTPRVGSVAYIRLRMPNREETKFVSKGGGGDVVKV